MSEPVPGKTKAVAFFWGVGTSYLPFFWLLGTRDLFLLCCLPVIPGFVPALMLGGLQSKEILVSMMVIVTVVWLTFLTILGSQGRVLLWLSIVLGLIGGSSSSYLLKDFLENFMRH